MCEMIGKSEQNTLLNRVAFRAFLTDVQAFSFCDPQKLLEQRTDLSRSLGMDSQPSTTVQVVSISIRVAPGAHQYKEIRLRFTAEQFVTCILNLPTLSSHQQIPTLRERCNQR